LFFQTTYLESKRVGLFIQVHK